MLEACNTHEVKKQGCPMLPVQQWQRAWVGCKLAIVGEWHLGDMSHPKVSEVLSFN